MYPDMDYFRISSSRVVKVVIIFPREYLFLFFLLLEWRSSWYRLLNSILWLDPSMDIFNLYGSPRVAESQLRYDIISR